MQHSPPPKAKIFVHAEVLESCKPNSVCIACATERIICLSGQYPGLISLTRDRSGPLPSPLFGLAPDGVFRTVPLTRNAVRSYRTFSPSPSIAPRGDIEGCLFSVALSVGTTHVVAARVYRRPDRRYAASRPVVFGLSSPGLRRKRFSALQNHWKLTAAREGNKFEISSRALLHKRVGSRTNEARR